MDQFRRINISPDNKEHAYIGKTTSFLLRLIIIEDATEDPEIRLQLPLPGSKLEKERLLEEQKKQPKKKITKPKEKKEEEADPKKNARASSAPAVGKEDETFYSSKNTGKNQAASRYLDYTKKKQKVVVNDDPDYLQAHKNRVKQRIKVASRNTYLIGFELFQLVRPSESSRDGCPTQPSRHISEDLPSKIMAEKTLNPYMVGQCTDNI